MTMTMNKSEQRILRVFQTYGALTSSEAANHSGANPVTVRAAIRGLLAKGRIKPFGTKKVGLHKVAATIYEVVMTATCRRCDEMDNLIAGLEPLFKEVREQSKRHYAMVSQGELLSVAWRGEQILEAAKRGDVEKLALHKARNEAREGKLNDSLQVQVAE
jgi:hypothetical protein